jgi:hypothetical protein
MNLQDFLLSEVSQAQKDKYHMFLLHVASKKDELRSREYNGGY